MSPLLHPVEPASEDGGRSDEALLQAHLAGDRFAFEHLVRRHERRLWAVALRTMRNPDDAADAVQDALVSAYRAAGSFRGQSAVGTWLHRIVVNACLDRLRRAKPTSELPDEEREHRRTEPDPTDQVDDRLRLQAALAALPEAQRLCVLLVDVEGLSVAETAELLGTAPGTVKSRCSRGRAALAAMLRAEPSGADPMFHVEPPQAPTRRSDGGNRRDDGGEVDR